MERQETIAAKIIEQLETEELLKIIDYRPDTIQRLEQTIKAFCPIHGELVFRTLIVDDAKKSFKCSYSLCPGNQGGDLVDLYALSKKISRGEAVEALLTHIPDVVEGAPAPVAAEGEAPVEGEVGIEELMQEALAHSGEQRWAESDEVLLRVLERDPMHMRALIGRTQCLEKQGHSEEARPLFARVIKAAIREGEINTAQAFFRRHCETATDVSEILQALEKLIVPCREATTGLNPLLEALIARAEKFESEERFEKALALYRAAEPVAPPELDLESYITQLLVQLGDTDQALAVHQSRCEHCLENSDLPGALACLREMMAIDPNRVDLRQSFIETAIEDGLSEDLFREVLDIIDGWIGSSEFGIAREALDLLTHYLPHESELQRRTLQIASDQGDQQAKREAALRMAQLCRQEGRPKEAIDYLKDFPLDPSAPEAVEMLALCQFEAERVEDAVETLQTLARHYENAGAWTSSESICAKMALWQPDEPKWQCRQAKCLKHMGEAERALSIYETAGMEFLAAGRLEEASQAWHEALEIEPGSVDIATMRHNLLLEIDRVEVAKQLVSTTVNYLKLNRDAQTAATFLQGCVGPEGRPLEVSLLLADLWTQAEQPQKAVEALQNALEMAQSKGDVDAQVRLAQRILSHDTKSTQALEIIAEHGPTASHAADKRRMLIQLGESHESHENWEKAVEAYEKALMEDPEDLKVRERLIRCHENCGDATAANRIRFQIAEQLYSQRQWKQALEAMASLLEGGAEMVIEHLALRCHIQLGNGEAAAGLADRLVTQLIEESDFEPAISISEQMLTLSDQRTAWQQRLLDLQQRAGLSDEALATAREILSRALESQDREIATATVDRLLELAPEDRGIREVVAMSLESLGDSSRARQELLALVGLHRKAGDHEQAATILRGLLADTPENTDVHRALMSLHVALGENDEAVQMHWDRSSKLMANERTDEAIAELEKLLELDPEHHDSRRRLVDLLRSRMRNDEAVEQLAILAQMLSDGDESERAVETWTEVVELRPEVIPYHTALITSELSAGGGQRMQEHVEALMNMLITRGETDEALKCLAKFEEFDPNLPLWQRWLGEVHTTTGNAEGAVEAFRRYSTMVDRHLSTRKGRDMGPGGESGGGRDEGYRLVPNYVFDNFIVGERNSFAFATCKAVAESPADAYNPLFLYSDVGLGKTHLVNSIGNHIRAHHPKLRVMYTSVEEFVSGMNEAIQDNSISEFRNRLRRVDVLLIDDVQFLSGKERAQEEFFHLFNTLFQAQKQIVVTSDRPPREMTYLEKRLRSRFGAGVIVDIQPPTLETRLAIAKGMAEEKGTDALTEEALMIVAERCTSSVRELKGAINQLLATASTHEGSLSKNEVNAVLDQLLETVT